MSVHFENNQTVIQFTPMDDFSFGFTEGSFLLLNGTKHLMSVAENLTSDKHERTEQIYQKRRRHGHYKILKPIFLSRSDFYSECGNKHHVMKTSSI